jgi:cell division transport system ATP-binding protein
MITFDQVHKNYSPHQPAITQLSFHIEAGEMIFIHGPSGAGKSTLLNLIAGITPASQGEIKVDNINIHELSSRQMPLYRRRLGLIFQKPMLLNNRSVYDNVAISLMVSGFYQSDIPKRVNTALEKVGLLHKACVLPCTLSGGEQQRLNIARAIVHKPTILLADEPTKHLDATFSAEVMDILTRFNQAGATVLIATHDKSYLQSGLYPKNSRQMDLQGGQLTCFN